jgi:lipoprotein NlpD
MIRWLVIAWIVLLTACTSSLNYAPVVSATIEPIPKSGAYRVQKGETLYSIAWRYGLDYRYLVQRNNISPPYHILSGQKIYLTGTIAPVVTKVPSVPEPVTTRVLSATKPVSLAKHAVPVVPVSLGLYEPTAAVKTWRWPAIGPVISGFSSLNKGINIGGHIGSPIFATATGKVVYSGNGIRGYGNLIIIKHNSIYLSAYAHNSVLLVREGTWVKAGQRIAEMGNSGTRRTMLHFEIRRGGEPVNPLKYLKRDA